MQDKFHLHKAMAHEHQYYCNIVAPNTQITFTSELYHNYKDCYNTVFNLISRMTGYKSKRKVESYMVLDLQDEDFGNV